MNEKLDRIEEVLAHQEQQIGDLSEMLIRQGREIDGLKAYLRKLQFKIDTLEEGGNEDKPVSLIEEAARNKPPHY